MLSIVVIDWCLLAEWEKKENTVVDVQEECFLVEEPEDVKKREALLRNVDVSQCFLVEEPEDVKKREALRNVDVSGQLNHLIQPLNTTQHLLRIIPIL